MKLNNKQKKIICLISGILSILFFILFMASLFIFDNSSEFVKNYQDFISIVLFGIGFISLVIFVETFNTVAVRKNYYFNKKLKTDKSRILYVGDISRMNTKSNLLAIVLIPTKNEVFSEYIRLMKEVEYKFGECNVIVIFYENQKDSFVKSVLSSPPSNTKLYFSKNLPIRTSQRFLIYGYYNKSENVVTFFTTWMDKEMYFKNITKCLDELQSQYSSEEEKD